MKLLAKGSYGYQILAGFRHTIAKYLGGDKIPKALYEKFFEQLNDVKKVCLKWICYNQQSNTDNQLF